MSIKIPLQITSILTEQSLVEDTVHYQLSGSILGVVVKVPVPVLLIERLDRVLQDDFVERAEPAPRAQPTYERAPSGYDIGIVDELDDPTFSQHFGEED
tara:strand:+ start:4317 stop:4613 length:297 start_codon:yes stop_codon:yes gene_type:complete